MKKRLVYKKRRMRLNFSADNSAHQASSSSVSHKKATKFRQSAFLINMMSTHGQQHFAMAIMGGSRPMTATGRSDSSAPLMTLSESLMLRIADFLTTIGLSAQHGNIHRARVEKVLFCSKVVLSTSHGKNHNVFASIDRPRGVHPSECADYVDKLHGTHHGTHHGTRQCSECPVFIRSSATYVHAIAASDDGKLVVCATGTGAFVQHYDYLETVQWRTISEMDVRSIAFDERDGRDGHDGHDRHYDIALGLFQDGNESFGRRVFVNQSRSGHQHQPSLIPEECEYYRVMVVEGVSFQDGQMDCQGWKLYGGHKEGVSFISFIGGNRILATTWGPDGCISVLSRETGAMIQSVSFSSDLTFLRGSMACTIDKHQKKIKMWRIKDDLSGTALVDSTHLVPDLVARPDYRVVCAAFSPNGSSFALAFVGRAAVAWSLSFNNSSAAKEATALVVPCGPQPQVLCMQYGGTEYSIATGHGDGWIRLWDAIPRHCGTARLIKTLQTPDACVSISINPVTKQIATGHESGTVRVWSSKRCKKVNGSN